MEKKLKNKKEKKNIPQSIYFYTIITTFVLMIIIGIIASKKMLGTFGATSYNIQFMGAEGYNLTADNSHYKNIAPKDGICKTDEYGFIDPDCAYKIACICREWSNTIAGELPNCDFPCQGVALVSNSLFTEKFNSSARYYCHGGSSYSTACDIEKPTNSCYECTAKGEKKYAKTINTTRAETYTGGTNCKVVADSECEPKPVTSCYSCKLGSGNEYAYATSTIEAANKTGGTSCTTVENTKCDNPPTSCYLCTKETESNYIKTTTKNIATNTYQGSQCTIVPDSECEPKPVTSCYACIVNNNTKYDYATSINEAKTIIGGENCSIVKDNYCKEEPKENPKTGTIYTIIAFILGMTSLTISAIYFWKSKI